jgi:hypothetical protein
VFCFCFTEIEEVFGGILEKEQDVSAGMAEFRTLFTFLEHDTCKCVLFLKRFPECVERGLWRPPPSNATIKVDSLENL